MSQEGSIQQGLKVEDTAHRTVSCAVFAVGGVIRKFSVRASVALLMVVITQQQSALHFTQLQRSDTAVVLTGLGDSRP
eukprot:6470858-Amphidinium_carterae.2